VISRDGVAGLCCLAGALLLLGMTRGLPQPALVPIGPGFYPRIVLGITALLGAALLVQDRVVVTFLIVAAYVFSLPWIGYRLATLGFVAGLQAALERPRGRRWWIVAVVAVVTTFATYYAFDLYLSVLLPRGRLTGF
jgi:putative tricarboxylic transport membrane protein